MYQIHLILYHIDCIFCGGKKFYSFARNMVTFIKYNLLIGENILKKGFHS